MRLPSPTDIRKEIQSRSLAEFARGAWSILEPATPLLWNWHLDAICSALENVSSGTTKKLIINVPPGSMKSLLTSVFWPAWDWIRFPARRWLTTSGGLDLVLRDAKKCRDLVDSEFYSKFRNWTWDGDQNAKGFYQNTATGFRKALSVGTSVTGNRGDISLVDDPMDAKKANSKTVRDNVLTWWKEAMSNRGSNPADIRQVVIMQRLHEDDLTGYLEKNEKGWKVLRFPMEFDPRMACPEDIRTVQGELLFPARFPESMLAAEREKGTYYYSGQYQQTPVPAGGGMFPKNQWRFWKMDGVSARLPRPKGCSDTPAIVINPETEKFDIVLDSWDCAFKGTADSDFVCRVRVAKQGARRFILDRSYGQLTYSKTKQEFKRVEGLKPRAKKKIVEDMANGPAVMDDLQAEVSGLIPIKPEGGKEARAWVMQPELEAGNWYLPEDAPWLEEFISEFERFPKGSHDDQVDATSQASVYLGPDSEVERLRKSVQHTQLTPENHLRLLASRLPIGV